MLKVEVEELIKIIKDDLDNIDKYSVYHGDIFNEEITEVTKLLGKMEVKLVGHEKTKPENT